MFISPDGARLTLTFPSPRQKRMEDNKALVLRLFDALNRRDIHGLADTLHDRCSWSIPYRNDRFPTGGERDKAAVIRQMSNFLPAFESLSFTVKNVVAEGDTVVVEAESDGVGPGKAVYHNIYLIIFLLRDGKIHTVREYFDPFEAIAYGEQLAPS